MSNTVHMKVSLQLAHKLIELLKLAIPETDNETQLLEYLICLLQYNIDFLPSRLTSFEKFIKYQKEE